MSIVRYMPWLPNLQNYILLFQIFIDIGKRKSIVAYSGIRAHGPLTRYVKLRVARAPGMPGTLSPQLASKETASQRSRHASMHVRPARAVMHVGIANPRWRGNVHGIPGACATRNFTYLARGPWSSDSGCGTNRECLFGRIMLLVPRADDLSLCSLEKVAAGCRANVRSASSCTRMDEFGKGCLHCNSWRRHEMKAFSALLALCVVNSPVFGEFPSQRASNSDFDVSLVWVWIKCSTSSRMAGDLRLRDVHLTSS